MPNSQTPVITIDGPTASGKGTVAQKVAQRLGFHYLDSGALYRLTALSAIRRNTALNDEHALAKVAEHLNCQFDGAHIFLSKEDVTEAIRVEKVGNTASKIAALMPVSCCMNRMATAMPVRCPMLLRFLNRSAQLDLAVKRGEQIEARQKVRANAITNDAVSVTTMTGTCGNIIMCMCSNRFKHV